MIFSTWWREKMFNSRMCIGNRWRRGSWLILIVRYDVTCQRTVKTFSFSSYCRKWSEIGCFSCKKEYYFKDQSKISEWYFCEIWLRPFTDEYDWPVKPWWIVSTDIWFTNYTNLVYFLINSQNLLQKVLNRCLISVFREN